MKTVLLLSVLVSIAFSGGNLLAEKNKADKSGLTVAGTMQGNVGCVILREHMPAKGKLLFAGVVYMRPEYDVLQTFDCKMKRQKFTGQGQIKQLNQLAVKDKLKLVIIPSKYTPEQLEEARKACQKQP